MLEDLGDETLLDKIRSGSNEFGGEKKFLYEKVIDELPKFQISAAKEMRTAIRRMAKLPRGARCLNPSFSSTASAALRRNPDLKVDEA